MAFFVVGDSTRQSVLTKVEADPIPSRVDARIYDGNLRYP